MNEPVHRIHVKIAGIGYQLVASGKDDDIRLLAAQTDEIIQRVQKANPQLSQNMATVLALVNALDEVNATARQLDIVQTQRDTLEQRLTETQTELLRIREQNWDMRKDLLTMQRLLRDVEQHLDTLRKDQPNAPANIADPADPPEADDSDSALPLLQEYQQYSLEDYL